MAGRAGDSRCDDRYPRALFAAPRRLLLAADERRRQRGAQAGGLLAIDLHGKHGPDGDEMSTEVVMPQMGESIAEGTITKWLKQVGERVERDEPLFEISTDKVDAEIPSPAAGTLTEVRYKEGDTVEVNTVVAVLDGDGTGAVKAAATQPTAVEPPPPEPVPPPAPAPPPPASAAAKPAPP